MRPDSTHNTSINNLVGYACRIYPLPDSYAATRLIQLTITSRLDDRNSSLMGPSDPPLSPYSLFSTQPCRIPFITLVLSCHSSAENLGQSQDL